LNLHLETAVRNSVFQEIIASDDLFALVIAQRPDRNLLIARRYESGRRGRWKEALDASERLIKLIPNDPPLWYIASALCIETGDLPRYRARCQEVLDRFENSEDPLACEQAVKACLLHPDAMVDLERVQRLADRAAAAATGRFRRWCHLVQGLAQYRRGNFSDAIEHVRHCLHHEGDPLYLTATPLLVQAMAQQRLGRHAEAQESLGQASLLLEPVRRPEDAPLDSLWPDWLRYQILRREAEQVVNAGTSTGP
jgi:tetratricopeptide (TPR) repeat protein